MHILSDRTQAEGTLAAVQQRCAVTHLQIERELTSLQSIIAVTLLPKDSLHVAQFREDAPEKCSRHKQHKTEEQNHVVYIYSYCFPAEVLFEDQCSCYYNEDVQLG